MVKSSPAENNALKRCLQDEEVSLEMRGVRERVFRIGRLYQVKETMNHYPSISVFGGLFVRVLFRSCSILLMVL